MSETRSVGAANTAMDPESIAASARSAIAEVFSRFDDEDQLVLEKRPDGMHVTYVSVRASRLPCDPTSLNVQFSFERGEMWLSNLQVSAAFRAQGVGSQLAAAAESIAHAMGLRIVNGFPLQSSRRFWAKMGYRAHPKTARVSTKDLHEDHTPASRHPVPSPLGSAAGTPATESQERFGM